MMLLIDHDCICIRISLCGVMDYVRNIVLFDACWKKSWKYSVGGDGSYMLTLLYLLIYKLSKNLEHTDVLSMYAITAL